MKGKLYLVPATLGHTETLDTIPEGIKSVVRSVNLFVVENVRSARRYLKLLDRTIDIDQLQFYELNEHTPAGQIPSLLDPAEKGTDMAILSEAGVPGVADPGAELVREAHKRGIRVIPLTGPSSILLSIMASGLNGQLFTFHGYLPIRRNERMRKIREMEEELRRTGATQLFIEAPYRNDALLGDLLDTCDPSTLLCIAADITLPTEMIRTEPVESWKNHKPQLHKRPVIFLLGK